MALTKDNIEKVWLTDTAVWIRTKDGSEACEELDLYPRLKWATEQQRENFTFNHYGIRWADVDEDLSYEGFFYKKPENRLYRIFMSHSELNASAIARRLGMTQSLFSHHTAEVAKLANNFQPTKKILVSFVEIL